MVAVQYRISTPDGHDLARLDLALPAIRLGIEADGHGPHGGVPALYRDRWRANALLGWSLLRFTWYDVMRRPGYVLATVGARLGAAAAAALPG